MKPTDETVRITTELKKLYRKWPEIKRFLRSMGCSGQQGEDIFQEALLIYVRKTETPGFVLDVDPFFYVRNTCKLLWYNEARKLQKNITVEITDSPFAEDEEWFGKEMKLRSVEQAMESLGKQCKELLQLFYGMGWNMTEIAKKIGLRNDKVAKAQKYRCLQKAKDLVQDQEALNVEFLTVQP